MARNPIRTIVFRAKDLLEDDVVQLRIHGATRWVQLSEDATLVDDAGNVDLEYINMVGKTATLTTSQWNLIRVQDEKVAQ